ncbi:hypothetical protein D3C84_600560 [compost metagenome]
MKIYVPGVKPANEVEVCFALIIGDGEIVSYCKVPTPLVAVTVTVVVVAEQVTAAAPKVKSVGGFNFNNVTEPPSIHPFASLTE